MLRRKRFENPLVHDEDGKHVSNPEEVYKTIKDYFKRHFYEESIESLPTFTVQQKNLDKPIRTEEVRQATLKVNNGRAARPDRISTKLVKYAPAGVHVFIQKLSNHVLKNHKVLDIGRGSLCPLRKSGKPKGPVKNLGAVILLSMLRKIISIILLKRVKLKYEDYISQSQSAYRSKCSTCNVVGVSPSVDNYKNSENKN